MRISRWTKLNTISSQSRKGRKKTLLVRGYLFRVFRVFRGEHKKTILSRYLVAFLLLFIIFFSTKLLAEITINLQNNFGYTIVSVSEAMETPEYSEISDQGLVEWNQFNYKGLIQILFKESETVSFGPEIGINRLYYWEEKHIPPMSSPRWRWGTIWTGHLGGIVRKSFASHYYVLTGASLHVFFNGTGATLGIPFAVGHELPISKVFTIPIEFRIDVVFGGAVPIGLGGGVGLKFKFNQ